MFLKKTRRAEPAPTGPTMPDTLSAAIAHVESLEAERAHIGEVLAEATAELKKAQRSLDGQREAQAAHEAEAALRGDGPNTKAFAGGSSTKVEALQARVAGLQAKQTEADASIAAARSEIDAAWRAFAAERVAEAKVKFETAAKELDQTIVEALATVFACGDGRLMRTLMRVSIVDGEMKHLIKPDRQRWRSNPMAAAINSELMQIRNRVLGAQGVVTATEAEEENAA